MPRLYSVLWTITPTTAPQPWRPCGACGEKRPFRCSEKFRLNANGKSLDAWLIYKCTGCDQTWNRAIFERRATRDIAPALLTALETSNPALVRRHAFDGAALRKFTHRVDEFDEVAVKRQPLGSAGQEREVLEIAIAAPIPNSLRLDRLLASELALSRNRIASMASAGELRTASPLDRPVRDGIKITLDLAADDAPSILASAIRSDET